MYPSCVESQLQNAPYKDYNFPVLTSFEVATDSTVTTIDFQEPTCCDDSLSREFWS